MKAILLFFLPMFVWATPRGEISLNSSYYVKEQASQASSNKFVKLQLQDSFKWSAFEFRFDLRSRADEEVQSYININELNASFNGFFLETYRLGYFIYNWSRLDFFHPANIINSRYINSDFEDIEKKGELSIVLDNETYLGNIKLFYFPKFEANVYPNSNSRVMDGNSPLINYVLDGDEITDANKSYHQYGLTIQNQIGDLDFNFFYFDHIDRNYSIIGYQNFSFVPSVGNVPVGSLSTHYTRVRDLGLSSTYFLYDHTLKLEVVRSDFENNDKTFLSAHGVVSFRDLTTIGLGHEYTHTFENGIDLTFFTEYQYVSLVGKTIQEISNIFENDLFIGQRISFNDFSAKELKYGIVYDLQRKNEWLFFINYDQRLNDAWKIRVSSKVITHSENDKVGLYLLKGDNELSLKLTRFF